MMSELTVKVLHLNFSHNRMEFRIRNYRPSNRKNVEIIVYDTVIKFEIELPFIPNDGTVLEIGMFFLAEFARLFVVKIFAHLEFIC